jgi:hypothetical protein
LKAVFLADGIEQPIAALFDDTYELFRRAAPG